MMCTMLYIIGSNSRHYITKVDLWYKQLRRGRDKWIYINMYLNASLEMSIAYNYLNCSHGKWESKPVSLLTNWWRLQFASTLKIAIADSFNEFLIVFVVVFFFINHIVTWFYEMQRSWHLCGWTKVKAVFMEFIVDTVQRNFKTITVIKIWGLSRPIITLYKIQ